MDPGVKFHDGNPVTPADVKWSFEHYRGAWGDVMHDNAQGVAIVGDNAVCFDFKQPLLDFPILFGTANVCGAGWPGAQARAPYPSTWKGL